METPPPSSAPPPPTTPAPKAPAALAKVFDKPRAVSGVKRREIPKGVWIRCNGCDEMITCKELNESLRVCPRCRFHFPARARDRVAWLADSGTFEEKDVALSPVDALGFRGAVSYAPKLRANQKKTGLKDAIVTGFCAIEGRRVGLAVMDFEFLGGSMGSVVGEKITRTIEGATRAKLPVILICASGGARMYEGMLSLMQMAKTSAALARHARARLACVNVLTNPTMAGVMASFGSLGDVILAEPKARIGFAGARVIRETTREELPEGFQTAEFLLEHGLIDLIVHRRDLKATLARILNFTSRVRCRARRA
ncbi:MAG: acetyl-CoA carboxylase carboxyltransferase subunit beta [Verrucomicrobiae bacterium]|nr:acetyl-CoA carboxylase carboxyltransferase subunit beta [Verrucomicrobiae bacterium]